MNTLEMEYKNFLDTTVGKMCINGEVSLSAALQTAFYAGRYAGSDAALKQVKREAHL